MAATDFKDYYAILGLTKTASADEIKKTFPLDGYCSYFSLGHLFFNPRFRQYSYFNA